MNMPVDTTFRAQWIPLSQDFGEIGLDELSAISARIGGSVDDGGEVTGGVEPYNIQSMSFIGGAPAVGISIVQTTTTLTGDTVQLQSSLATPTGSYAGTIRAVVRDASAAPQTLTLDLLYTLDVANAAVNTGDETAASLDPTHWYPFDDIIDVGGNGEARDIGSAATKLPLTFGAGQTWEGIKHTIHMPGPGRGSPRTPALWAPRAGPTTWRSDTGPVKTGWLTGGFSMWVFVQSFVPFSGEQTLHSIQWENNSGLWGGLGIENSNGSFFCELTWNNNPRIKFASGGSTIEPMKWHHVAAMQRADGNGIILYIDGVPVSTSQTLAGSATVDSWFDGIMQSDTNRDTSIPGIGIGFQLAKAHIYQPLTFVNNPPSAAQILALYNSIAGSFSADAVDYMDAVQENVVGEFLGKSLRYWHEGPTVGNNDSDTVESGYISSTSNDGRFSTSGMGTPPTMANQLANFPVTGYRADRAARYGTNDPTFFVPTGEFRSEDDEEAIGTLNAWVKIESITPDGSQRLYMGMGRVGFEWIEVGVEGDRFFCEVQNNSQANKYRREVSALAPQSLRVQVGDYYMLTATQAADGNGFLLYVNGVLVDGADGVDTLLGAGDLDYWLKDIGPAAPPPNSGQWGLRVGGQGGSQTVENWEPNELMAWYWLDRVMSPAEIAATYAQGLEITPSFAAYITANLTGRRHDYLFDEASGNIIDNGSAPENLDTFIGTALEYEQWGYQPADSGQVGIDFNFTSVAQSNTIAANFWGDDTSGTILLFGYFAATNDPGTYYFMSGLQSAASPPRNGAGIFWLPSSNRLGIFLSGAVGNNYDQRWEVPGGLPINRALVIAFVQRSDGGGIRCFLNGTELPAAASTPLGTFDVDSWLDEVGDPTTFFVGNINFSGGDFTAASRMMRLLTTNVALTTQQVADLFVASGTDRFIIPNNIAEQIAALSPEHYWPMNDAASPVLDAGTNTQAVTIDFTQAQGAPDYQVSGPDFSTLGINFGIGVLDILRNGALIQGGTTGTVLFYTQFAFDAGTFLSVDSANETNGIYFGIHPKGVDPLALNRLALGFFNGLFDYRILYADDTIATMGIDDAAYHLIGFTQDGVNRRIYVDGVEVNTSETTAGTVPNANSWFQQSLSPTRSIMASGRFSSAEADWRNQTSTCAVFRNVVLTAPQQLALAALIE